MRRRARLLAAAVAAALTVSALIGSPATAGERSQHCVDQTLPVRLADPGPAGYSLWGRLCWSGRVKPATVQLLAPGGTYDHQYWDFPYERLRYSYVDAATRAGFATFELDMVGSGRSSVPPSSVITAHAQAVSLHDVVTALRAGRVAGHRFRQVIWVGHSYGSIVGAFEISRYHDVDGFVATGMLHAINTVYFGEYADKVWPAGEDPKFAGLGLDDGYATTTPGSRDRFYAPGTVDPGVLITEERTKAFQAGLDINEVAALLTPATPGDSPTRRIGVPVLIVGGQNDRTYCGDGFVDCTNASTVLAHEAPYYRPAAHLKIVIIPGTGHSVALSTTNRITTAAMLAWAKDL